jgi:hypothetical protein
MLEEEAWGDVVKPRFLGELMEVEYQFSRVLVVATHDQCRENALWAVIARRVDETASKIVLIAGSTTRDLIRMSAGRDLVVQLEPFVHVGLAQESCELVSLAGSGLNVEELAGGSFDITKAVEIGIK